MNTSATDAIRSVEKALEADDVDAARKLVRDLSQAGASDADLEKKISACKRLIERSDSVEQALAAMTVYFEADRYCDALSSYRAAICLAQGLPALKARVSRAGEKRSEELLPRNWRIAEAMLQEPAAANSCFPIPSELSSKILQAQQEEALSKAIYQTDRVLFERGTDEAKRQLTELLSANPDEVRIKERLESLDRSGQSEASATPKLPLQAISLGYDDLDVTGTTDKPEVPKRRLLPSRVVVKSSTWSTVKDAAVLVASTAMLGAAGLLVWLHFAAKAPASVPRKPAESQIARASDEQAWERVKASDDPVYIRSFLSTFPGSSHAFRAKVKLAAIVWDKLDKNSPNDLDAYLRTYPESPYKTEAEHLKLLVHNKPGETNER